MWEVWVRYSGMYRIYLHEMPQNLIRFYQKSLDFGGEGDVYETHDVVYTF